MLTRGRLHRRRCERLLAGFQHESGHGATAHRARDRQLSAHQLDESAGQYQPDTCALDLGVFGAKAVEGLKQVGQLVARNPGSGVRNHDLNCVATKPTAHPDGAAAAVVLDTVGQ